LKVSRNGRDPFTAGVPVSAICVSWEVVDFVWGVYPRRDVVKKRRREGVVEMEC